ncbi:hypothetical protein [Bacillus sp. S/N-304-OC-R1]|uniref:hypothetical protein n=1 Tax=Bacillus sp. S/N-304-OC-R1 TaxID=2758034 RepID=UPI001C8ECC33|nr:hypothetical protein [Bacillus sp. S/N-304-OC-R1]MBY0122371.1 hypothetical protein [Bacillus sp. S/N-304-OC-R1]
MKRLAFFLITVLIIYVIYVDLTKGMLPNANEREQAIETMAENTTLASPIPYFEEKVLSGDTVLSVVEKNMDGPISVSINEVITDFKILNNGLSPEKIKSGFVYKFPDYRQ